MRFRTKLLSFLSVTMILVVFLCIFSANKAFKTLSFTNEQQLLSKHVSYLAEEIVSQKGVWSASSLGQYAQSHEVRITLMDRQGKVLYDSEQQVSLMDNHAFRLEVKQALANGIGFSDRLSNTSGLSMMYAAKLVDDTPYIVRVGERLSIIKEWQSSFGSLLLPLLVLVLIIVFFFSLLLVRNLTKPLEQMVLTAKEYGKGNLQEHSWVDKPEELATLSSTMDWMASELASQMEKLRTDKSQYSSILETMTEGVILIDIHKKVILANRASFAMTGSKEIGQSLLAFFSDNHLIELVDKTLEKGTVEQDILTRTSFQGETIFQITTAPIKKDHEEVTGAVITSSDITELKRLEQIRKDFVANVSHELKTPLTSILGFTEILCSVALSEEDRIHFAQIVQRNGKQMQNIISDLLTLSSLEKDNNIIPMTPVAIQTLIQDTLLGSSYKAEEKQTQIKVENTLAQEATLICSQSLMTQALLNLVMNAILYSPDHSLVTLRIAEEGNQYLFSVMDHGCGIAPQEQQRIFERFYRVEKAHSRSIGGTGLGLSIVKHVAILHKGTITVQSVLNKGSVFTLTIPKCGTVSALKDKSDRMYPLLK